jgi:hypothetical protein
MVISMATGLPAPMPDDRRGLLTDRERAILTGDADVTDSYQSTVVTRVRRKIERIGTDAELLAEHKPDLLRELQAEVCEEVNSDE